MIRPKHDRAVASPDARLQFYAQFIRSIVQRHGPTAEEDAEVHRVADEVYDDLHSGRLQMKDIHFLRAQFGYTLSSCETLQGHALAKPHGYPGDFELFDKIYTRHVNPDPRLQRWDEFFHRLAACEAVRNRKTWLLQKLHQTLLRVHRPLTVLIVGSGPGRDALEFLQQHPQAARFDCVELDPKAIDYARQLCAPVIDHIRFHQGSILRYRTKTRYDAVWSGGLFDYFNDRLFGRVLSQLMGLLHQEGELTVGNFATPNSSRAFMELVSDWKLTLRTPEQLRRLASQIDLEGLKVRVESEPAGVNLFLRLSR
jgi:SAM-dependent methyltransferase